MRGLRVGLIPLVLGAGLLLSSPADRPPAPRASGAASAADSLDDGPHVYWEDGSHAVVFYLCGGAVPAIRYEARDTLAFTGLCTDSTTVYRLPTRAPRPDRDTWDRVSRILAISDIHGEYDAMVAFLKNASVIDSLDHWAWGTGHLVVVGDVVDRGARVTDALWFLHGLEQEAERAGGRVHVLLGNHEMMVMRDDLRYVNAKYTDGIVRYAGVRYPDLFGPDMELGRWLRSKPIVLKLNDIVFVHGGLAPEMVTRGLDLHALNTIGRQSLDLSSVALTFSDLPRLVLGSTGPFWYRGYLYALNGRYPATTSEQLDSLLHFYGATAFVVGHTEIGQIARLHEGRVYAIDMSLETEGAYQGLLWENGVFRLVTGTGAVRTIE